MSDIVIAAPQLIAMSREVGRPSFGENGTINYALYVNGYDLCTGYSTRRAGQDR